MQLCTVLSVTCHNSGLSDLWTSVTTVMLISNCRAVPQRLTDPELLQTFPKLYGARKFPAVFTTSHYLSLSQVTLRQSTLFHPMSLWSTVMLRSVQNVPYPSGCRFLCSSLPRVQHLTLLHFVILTVFGSQYKSRTISLSHFDKTQLMWLSKTNWHRIDMQHEYGTLNSNLII